MTTQTILPGVQILTERGNIRRMAWCPEHGNRTSAFVGVQGSLLGEPEWRFKCLTATHGAHAFTVPADPNAPTSLEETDRWVAQQKANLLAERSRKKGK